MAEPSWYVLEREFGAPNDALSKQLRATSLEDVHAHLAGRDPEELLCDPLLAADQEDTVLNPKAMARLSAQRGLSSSWKPSG